MTWSELISIYNSIPTGLWQLIGSALAVSPLLTGIKHFFEIQSTKKYKLLPFVKVSGEQLMVLLLAAVSGIASAVAYVLGSSSSNPTIVVLHGALLAFSTQPIYFFIVKPIYSVILASIKASATEAEMKTAAVPAGGLPITTLPTEPAADFSE